MKRYLWVGVAALCMGANASDNPFELKLNFGKLDRDEATILGALKKAADKQGEVEKATVAKVKKPKIVEKPKPVIKVEKEDTLPSLEVVEKSISKIVENKDETPSVAQVKSVVENPQIERMRQKAMEKAREEHAKKMKEKEASLEKSAKEKPKPSMSQKEAERREVEAYEKRRAAKLAEKKKIAEALEKVAQAQKEEKQKAKKAKSKKVVEKVVKKVQIKKVAIKPTVHKKPTPPAAKKVGSHFVLKRKKSVSSVDDINLTREANLAKQEADRLYEEAVREMSQED